MVADLYRWWYPQHQMPASRLLVDSFTLHAPLLTIKTGLIPYWLFFNVDAATDRLENYLDTASFEEIYLMILSHGNDSIGLTSISRWKSLMARASKKGDFIGTDPDKYPLDFGVYAQYSIQLKKKIQDRFPLPPSLTIRQLSEFINTVADKYKVSYTPPSKIQSIDQVNRA